MLSKPQQKVIDNWPDGFEAARPNYHAATGKVFFRDKNGNEDLTCWAGTGATFECLVRVGVVKKVNRDPWVDVYELI